MALYRHIRDKDDLLDEVVDRRTTRQFTEGLRYLLEGISGHAGTGQATGRTKSRAPRRRSGPGSAAET